VVSQSRLKACTTGPVDRVNVAIPITKFEDIRAVVASCMYARMVQEMKFLNFRLAVHIC